VLVGFPRSASCGLKGRLADGQRDGAQVVNLLPTWNILHSPGTAAIGQGCGLEARRGCCLLLLRLLQLPSSISGWRCLEDDTFPFSPRPEIVRASFCTVAEANSLPRPGSVRDLDYSSRSNADWQMKSRVRSERPRLQHQLLSSISAASCPLPLANKANHNPAQRARLHAAPALSALPLRAPPVSHPCLATARIPVATLISISSPQVPGSRLRVDCLHQPPLLYLSRIRHSPNSTSSHPAQPPRFVSPHTRRAFGMASLSQRQSPLPLDSPLREHRNRPVERLTDSLETPSLDDRSYRVIRLPNQLEVLLVHDADTDKASAAMDVNVGNFSDEEEYPGMAHAVE
jgi:hypothetical protein